MKKLYFLITLVISLSTFSQNEKLQLNSNDLKELQPLVDSFEVILKKYYSGVEINTAYNKYILDLLQRKVNPKIIKEQKCLTAFREFRTTSTFEKIWIKNSINPEIKSDVIDYNGLFFSYIITNTKNKDLKQEYIEFKMTNHLNPHPNILISGMDFHLQKSEYGLIVNKLSIAIMFYYDIIIQFNK